MAKPVILPYFEYDGSQVGQVVEEFKSFKDSLITQVANEYWRAKVVNSLDKRDAFYLASHRNSFARKHAEFAKQLILQHKQPGDNSPRHTVSPLSAIEISGNSVSNTRI